MTSEARGRAPLPSKAGLPVRRMGTFGCCARLVAVAIVIAYALVLTYGRVLQLAAL